MEAKPTFHHEASCVVTEQGCISISFVLCPSAIVTHEAIYEVTENDKLPLPTLPNEGR